MFMILNNIYIIWAFGAITVVRLSKNLLQTFIIALLELVAEGGLMLPSYELRTILVKLGYFKHDVAVAFVSV